MFKKFRQDVLNNVLIQITLHANGVRRNYIFQESSALREAY